ncbi:permease-like cell division protein FtsX [uncultured Fretibacterium sp.]|uniref:cell division protein FtsX n=1 Tax=uncultured Fretibacterium sp. TaxID=1678694 RepID=UPI00260AA23A|nr:permease-like cell division protein FtsX [uncultured Fretibacterium sp.]
MTTFKYILRDMGRLLIHHWVLGLLTLITASVMLWILGLTTLFSFNIRTFLSQLESELVVQVFLKKGSEVERVAESIRAMPSVADLQAFSPDESLARLQMKMGSQSRALDLMGANPIPWNFKVRVRSARDVEPLVRTLMSMPDVDDVVYAGMVVQRVSALSRVAARIALLVFALSVVVTSLVVYNTIHISLYSRREEISIMYLVGATRSYIATPFVLEGTFLVLLGALIAVTGIVATYLPGIRILQENLPFLTLASDSRLIGRFCILLTGFGATLGWVCSCIVVARFMHSATSPE